jgi:hypothetical protein
MSEARKTEYSLRIDLEQQDLAREVAAEVGVTIRSNTFIESREGGTGGEELVPNRVSLYFDTVEDYHRFRRAFGLRRWRDRNQTGG